MKRALGALAGRPPSMATTWRSTPTSCSAISAADWKRAGRIGVGRPQEEPVERRVAPEDGDVVDRRQRGGVAARVLEAAEVEA